MRSYKTASISRLDIAGSLQRPESMTVPQPLACRECYHLFFV
jgi:hypothetical protein